MKEKFYIVYLEDCKTGKRIDDGDIINHHLTWAFFDEEYAHDFATLLTCYLKLRYKPCVAECSSSSSTKYNVKFL